MNPPSVEVKPKPSYSCCAPVYGNPIKSLEITPTPNFDFSKAIETVYPLTDLICSYLNYNDLHNVSLISNNWKISAQKELVRRNIPTTFTCYYEMRKTGNIYITNWSKNNFHFWCKENTLIFINHMVKKDKRYEVFYHDNCEHSVDVIPRTKKNSVKEFISNEILRNSAANYCILCLSQIESPFGKKLKDDCSEPIISGLFIPKINNIRIKFFSYIPNETFENGILNENEKFEAMLVFSVGYPQSHLKKLMNDLNDIDNSDIAIGGGIINDILDSEDSFLNFSNMRGLFCIGFISQMSGNILDSCFTSASLVVPEGEMTTCLPKFKDVLQFREHSILFRICCGDLINTEIDYLNQQFPNIFLVELEVAGEIGCNRYPSYPRKMDHSEAKVGKKRKVANQELYHVYTTILVLLTWGRLLG